MALVKPLDENEIETELCEFIQFFKGPLGVIPNSVRTMSRRPKVAKAFTELYLPKVIPLVERVPHLSHLVWP